MDITTIEFFKTQIGFEIFTTSLHHHHTQDSFYDFFSVVTRDKKGVKIDYEYFDCLEAGINRFQEQALNSYWMIAVHMQEEINHG